MPLGVVDVGSNTIRLLVARTNGAAVDPIFTKGVRVGLGRSVEADGAIPPAKIDEAGRAAARLCRLGASHGAASVELLVTAPGRQAANGHELVEVLRRASGRPTRVLSAEDECLLAFAGALAHVPPAAPAVAVVDLGGGSTEVAVGRPESGVDWLRSFDVGALRLTTRFLGRQKPSAGRVREAAAAVAEGLGRLTPPLAGDARAVGGCARALRKIVGPQLGADELDEAVRVAATSTHAELATTFDVHRDRAPLVLAGALVLAEVQRRLVVPLAVVDGGVREGALLARAAAETRVA